MAQQPENTSRRRLPSGRQGNLYPGGRYGYRLERKREEAKERQAIRDAMTDEEQLARLDAKGYVAKKERARLNARIEARKNPKPPAKQEGKKGPKNLKGKQKKLAEQASE